MILIIMDLSDTIYFLFFKLFFDTQINSLIHYSRESNYLHASDSLFILGLLKKITFLSAMQQLSKSKGVLFQCAKFGHSGTNLTN